MEETANDDVQRSNAMLWLVYLLVNLVGSNVAFDTTTENYTVSVSGKCVLTCYVSEIRSFKVSRCTRRKSCLQSKHDLRARAQTDDLFDFYCPLWII